MNDNTPLVIVRTVARNAEKTLERTIKSIYAQTHKNWELHLVDNASTDGTLQIMQEYAAKDPRVRVFQNEGNYVWKKGNRFTDYYNEYNLENTYMCHIDADDEYTPEFMEKMLAFADKHNLDIACCGYKSIDADSGKVLDELKIGETLIIEGDGFDTYFPVYHRFARLRVAKLFKLTVTDKVIPSGNVDILHGGDTAETLEYFRNAGRVGICPQQFYIYYYLSSSIGKKWWGSRPADDRTLYDITSDYLMKKTGRISTENSNYLHRVFYYAIRDNLSVLLSVDLPLADKIAALHDIFMSQYTRDLVKYYCVSDDSTPGEDVFKAVINFIATNAEKLGGKDSMEQASDIISVISAFSDDYAGLGTTVMRVIIKENAASVLEISGFDTRYGTLIQNTRYAYLTNEPGLTADRIDLTDGIAIPEGSHAGIYTNAYHSDILSDVDKMNKYDVIIIFHLFENMENVRAKSLLEKLLAKANKQVLVVTPEYSYDLTSSDENKKADARAYNPVFFLGMDYSYIMKDTIEGIMQVHSFFPKRDYKPLPCDNLPEKHNITRKLSIAYVLFNHGKSGALKAVYAHIKEFAKRGHRISVYYRRSVAENYKQGWNIPKDIGISKQVAVPDDAVFLEYIEKDSVDARPDIIILSWFTLVPEFEKSKIPVALWEQGSEQIYADYYGQLLCSDGDRLAAQHYVYRKPVYLLAVSHVVQAVLKGRYNRDAQCFHVGIDTDFYYPLEDKQNDVPVVMLVGSPLLKWKGFLNTFPVLEKAYREGYRFKAVLATQNEFTLSPKPSFPLEIVIDPPQDYLAELYRNADIYLTTSLIECFPLPPIEAMASGAAVVAMDSGGIRSYAEPGVNCLLCEQGDVRAITYALEELLGDPAKRAQVAAAGRETALKFSLSNIGSKLEDCLYKIVAHAESQAKKGSEDILQGELISTAPDIIKTTGIKPASVSDSEIAPKKVIFRCVARNAEESLERTCESVFAQTHENWELHLVDNASEDGTAGIMKKYAEKDKRVKVFLNEGNYVWKKGNKFTDYYKDYDLENTYMCHIDADDEYKPEFLEEMLRYMLSGDLDIAVCGYDQIDEKTGKYISSFKPHDYYVIEGDAFDTGFPVYHFRMRTRWGKLIKLTVTDRLNLDNIVWLFYYDDTIEMLEHFRVAGRVGYTPESYYKYYVDQASYTYRWDSRRNGAVMQYLDLTLKYLQSISGQISPTNYAFALMVYNGELKLNFKILTKAEMTDEERLYAMHEIITSPQTMQLVQYSFDSGVENVHYAELAKRWASENYNTFILAMNWVNDNFENYQKEEHINMLLEIVPILEKWQRSIDGSGV